MTNRSALVIGGTGPTGPHMVHGLVERGFDVTVFHTGNHELDEVAHVPHIHGDVRSVEGVTEALDGLTFDVALVTYGRLRAIAEVLEDRVGQFISVGGFPALRGYFDAEAFTPPGLPVPTNESGQTADEENDGKSYRIARTESMVFDHHPTASHFRYPMVYGPRQLAPREWIFVRRALDGRPHVILPDGGLHLNSCGYAENLAHALMLAVEQPEAASGQIFHAADEEILTTATVAALVADELGHEWRVVNMPFELAPCTKPMVTGHMTTHRMLDISKLKTVLGYRDKIPAREAIRKTARWLAENPCEPGGVEERVLEDPFDYATEDQLIAKWDAATSDLSVEWPNPPGYGLSYGGPGSSYVRANTRI